MSNRIAALLIYLWMLPASAQVSIGINLQVYPDLTVVPGYPVYYAPQLDSNYFFYDGLYWVYQDDNWYASSWYNGPWWLMSADDVPLYILRVPVRYYRQPPMYFRDWRNDAAPRWGEHWGSAWAGHRRGWDQRNRKSMPAPAPLPLYQRQYSGERYPVLEQQQALRSRNYHYQPREIVVRQHLNALPHDGAPVAPAMRQEVPSRQGRVVLPAEKERVDTRGRGDAMDRPARQAPPPTLSVKPSPRDGGRQDGPPHPPDERNVAPRQDAGKANAPQHQMQDAAQPAKPRPIQRAPSQQTEPFRQQPESRKPPAQPEMPGGRTPDSASDGPGARPRSQGQGAERGHPGGEPKDSEDEHGRRNERGQGRNQ
jgi:hypothetical protein